MGAYNDFVNAVREKLERESLSVRSAAKRAGLPIRSVQGILEGHIPSVERAAEVADALGLEFYIGPPREDEITLAVSRFRDADAIEGALRRGLAPTVSNLDEVLARLPDKADEQDPTPKRHVEVKELEAAPCRRHLRGTHQRGADREARGERSERRLAAAQRPPGLEARTLARRRRGDRRGEVDGADALRVE